jgi:formate dehydrogenase subunit gamma
LSDGRLLADGTVLRYTLRERLLHWLVGLTYVYLLLTGLAFYSPHLYWLAVMLGGGPTVRVWHPLVGVIFFIALLWMFIAWRKDMRMTEVDRLWMKSIRSYVRNEDENLPPTGRFNPGQKQFFWVMFWSSILLFLSGLVLWFTEYIPWNWRTLRHAAVLVHTSAALVTIGGFIIHIYMGTAVVPGGFTSITRGKVSKAWAKMHHPLWFDKITTGTSPKK